MKTMGTLVLLAAAITLATGLLQAQPKPATGFDQLKTLVGEWDGKSESGKSVRASYRLVSSGTALLETLNPPDEADMVTVYHPDGSHLALTHYCAGNNQPRMRTAAIAGSTTKFDFNFMDVSNLASPTAGHMHHLTVNLEDNDHFTQTWTWLENGAARTEVLHFTRKK